MRLSAYVNQNGIDAFNFEDFVFVSREVAQSPEPLILVGGQALETWGLFLNVLAPNGERTPLTEDTDWLGSQKDAQWLCKRLGLESTELLLADHFDPSPSTALAYLKRPDGRILMMDFLRTIVGPKNEEIRRLAVPVTVAGQVTLHVLHPLLCLESRMANLAVIAAKRIGNGPMQAVWAVKIVAAYLQQSVKTDSSDQMAKACRMIVKMAESKHGRYCWIHFKIDPLQAITENLIQQIGGGFADKEWPRIVQRLSEKRKKWGTSVSQPGAF